MHFHLPKPLHGWREFAGEVGIIVIGVLIALSAEQLVERWHWAKQADEARAALRAELVEDNLPQAYARLAIATCLDTQLQQLQSGVDHGLDRSKFVALARGYLPPTRTWDDQAWNAVVATGDLSHGGSGELIQWSAPYRLIAALGPRNESERSDRETLRSMSAKPGQLTPVELDRTTVALEHLRNDADRMLSGSKALLATAREAGVSMSAEQQNNVLNQLRPQWGGCVQIPSPVSIDPSSQDERQSNR